MVSKEGGEQGVDLPIRVYRGSPMLRVFAVCYVLLGLVCLLLSCLAMSDQPFRISGFIGLILMSCGLMMARADAKELVCEISQNGIRASEGFWRQPAFLPWEQVARCEIVGNGEDGMLNDFMLWDRSGRRRFVRLSTWLSVWRPSECTGVIHALRSRFPLKVKPGQNPEPVPAHQASSTLWDRELDG
jgi:hypothetical protein